MARTDDGRFGALTFSEAVDALPTHLGDEGEISLSVIRMARIMTDDQEEICLIRSISDRSVTLRVRGIYRRETKARIRSGHKEDLVGTIQFCAPNILTIRLDDPIDPESFIAGATAMNTPSRGGADARREPRFQTLSTAKLTLGGHRRQVLLRDLSCGGARIDKIEGLHPRDRVTLEVGGLDSIRGRIIWIRGNQAGMIFSPPLPIDMLYRWARYGAGAAPAA